MPQDRKGLGYGCGISDRNNADSNGKEELLGNIGGLEVLSMGMSCA